jgi:hypothetical protein
MTTYKMGSGTQGNAKEEDARIHCTKNAEILVFFWKGKMSVTAHNSFLIAMDQKLDIHEN